MDKINQTILVDSNSLICRYFFAMRNSSNELTNSDGIPINGLFGYLKCILSMMKKYKNSNIIAVFDKCYENFRKEILPEYKSNRQSPDQNLRIQLNLAMEFCKESDIPYDFHSKYEADDIIASYTKTYHNKQFIILSTDKDLLQLVSDNVKIFNPFKKSFLDESFIMEKFGIPSNKLSAFLAICGDSSDNIPGIKGIGPKGAAKILNSIHDIKELEFITNFNYQEFRKMLSLTYLSNNSPLKHNLDALFMLDKTKIKINLQKMQMNSLVHYL